MQKQAVLLQGQSEGEFLVIWPLLQILCPLIICLVLLHIQWLRWADYTRAIYVHRGHDSNLKFMRQTAGTIGEPPKPRIVWIYRSSQADLGLQDQAIYVADSQVSAVAGFLTAA